MKKSNIIFILIILGLIAALFLDLGGIIGNILGEASGNSISQRYSISFLSFSDVSFDNKTGLFSAELENSGSKDIRIIIVTVHYVHEGVAYEKRVDILIKSHSSKTIELKLEKEPHRVSVTTDKYEIVVLWHEGSCEGRPC